MNEPPPREVVRSKDFEDDAAFIEPELERFDEMFRGIEWLMARSPLLGRVVVRLRFGPNRRQVKVTALVTEQQAILTGIEYDEAGPDA